MSLLDKYDSKLLELAQPWEHNNNINRININIILQTKYTNPSYLYNNIRNHPALTEEILINIIKTLKNHNLSKHTTLSKCWLITPEFCDKYKHDLNITIDDMICNQLPVNYILSNYTTLTKTQYYNISKYCTKDEYYKYCKPNDVEPSLGNPNMTIPWYLENINIKFIDWESCVTIRPDLFNPDTIIKYVNHICIHNNIWKHYFHMFPINFIIDNLHITYTHLHNCIEQFRLHPAHISWDIIDKYITIHDNVKQYYHTHKIKLPTTTNDLPIWFIKKYINYIYITPDIIYYGKENHINYKLLINILTPHCINYSANTLHEIRNKYITLLNNVYNVCNDYNICDELINEILKYC